MEESGFVKSIVLDVVRSLFSFFSPLSPKKLLMSFEILVLFPSFWQVSCVCFLFFRCFSVIQRIHIPGKPATVKIWTISLKYLKTLWSYKLYYILELIFFWEENSNFKKNRILNILNNPPFAKINSAKFRVDTAFANINSAKINSCKN